jgi:hypothetical protein
MNNGELCFLPAAAAAFSQSKFSEKHKNEMDSHAPL